MSPLPHNGRHCSTGLAKSGKQVSRASTQRKLSPGVMKIAVSPENGCTVPSTLAADSSREVRTPSLRNIAVTAPYMHDGAVDSLREAAAHQAGDLSAKQIDDIVAFLHTLTDARGAVRAWPPLAASPCP